MSAPCSQTSFLNEEFLGSSTDWPVEMGHGRWWCRMLRKVPRPTAVDFQPPLKGAHMVLR